VAYSAIGFAVMAILTSTITIPMAYNYVQSMGEKIRSEMASCQSNAKDIMIDARLVGTSPTDVEDFDPHQLNSTASIFAQRQKRQASCANCCLPGAAGPAGRPGKPGKHGRHGRHGHHGSPGRHSKVCGEEKKTGVPCLRSRWTRTGWTSWTSR